MSARKGLHRTTARDIASAAGVSLAAIGYHFASKEALLTEALLLAFGEWDQELQKTLRTAVPPASRPQTASRRPGRRSLPRSKPTARSGSPTLRSSRRWSPSRLPAADCRQTAYWRASD